MNNLQNQTKKGFKMALPFLAGLAVGGLAVVAWSKRDKIKECAKRCKRLHGKRREKSKTWR